MENTRLAATELRERMRSRGIPVVRLAAEAGMYTNEVYRVLAGGPLGEVRRARFTEAVRKLGLTDEDETSEP